MVLVGIILAFTSMFLWSFSDFVTKISLERESLWKTLFISQFFGGLFISFIAFFFVDFTILASYKIYYLFLLSLLNVVGMYTFYKSLKNKGLTLTSSITYSWIIVTVFLGVIFYHEFITSLQWIAIFLIVLGIFVTTSKKEQITFDSSFLYAMGSMIIWGFFFFLLKIPTLLFGALLVTSIVKISTSFFSLPLFLKEKINLFETKKNVLILLILIGAFDSLGFLAFNFATNYSPISHVAAIGSAVPVLNVIIGILLLKEKITRRQKLGILAAITGIILILV